MESFLKYQEEADNRLRQEEDERWKKELEMEERRRQEYMEHERRMMDMLFQMFRQLPNNHSYPGTYAYDEPEYYRLTHTTEVTYMYMTLT